MGALTVTSDDRQVDLSGDVDAERRRTERITELTPTTVAAQDTTTTPATAAIAHEGGDSRLNAGMNNPNTKAGR